MCSKSKTKDALRGLFSDQRVFFHDYDACKKSHVVVDDCCLRWYNFTNDEDEDIKTGKDLLRHMVAIPDQFITDRNSTVSVVALMFDKNDFVPPIKAWIRAKRAPNNVEPFAWDGESTIVEFDKPLPRPWGSLNANRKARQRAFEELCVMLRDHYRPKVPFRTVIIDGWKSDATRPWIIQWDNEKEAYRCLEDHEIPVQFTNQIGEADHTVIRMSNYFSSQGMNVLTIGSDTDFLFTHIMHARTRMAICKKNNVTSEVIHYINKRTAITCDVVDCADENSTITVQKNGKSRVTWEHDFFDVDALFKAMEKDYPTVKYAPESIALCAISITGDYIAPFPGTPAKYFIQAFSTHFGDAIGDLVTMPNESQITNERNTFILNRKAYRELVKFAYLQVARYQKKLFPDMESSLSASMQRSYSWDAVANAVTMSNPKRFAFDMPSNEQLKKRCLMTEWYLKYTSEGPITPLPMDNYEEYGWEWGVNPKTQTEMYMPHSIIFQNTREMLVVDPIPNKPRPKGANKPLSALLNRKSAVSNGTKAFRVGAKSIVFDATGSSKRIVI